jgi:hypothetical protein
VLWDQVMQVNLNLQLNLWCDSEWGIVLLSKLWWLNMWVFLYTPHNTWFVWISVSTCKKTECKVCSMLPVKKVILYLKLSFVWHIQWWVYCVLWLQECQVIALFPIKEPAVVLLIVIYCLHQGYMVIRKWVVLLVKHKMSQIIFLHSCVKNILQAMHNM